MVGTAFLIFTEGALDCIGYCTMTKRFLFTVSILVLGSLMVACQPENDTASKEKAEPPAQVQATLPTPDSAEQVVAAQSVNTVPPRDTESVPALSVSFCGIRTLQGQQEFKLFDWDTETDHWVKSGEAYRGFEVVGYDKDQNALVLEASGYWYLHPLENLTRSTNKNQPERSQLIMASDIPEGVDVMDYISKHAEPLNPDDMPENMEVLNPNVVMPTE
jgi:hypothetical protein